MTPMLSVRELQAGYGQAAVLQGIDLDVAKGEVVAILGRNGAGKSTLLKTLIGLVAPRAGTITLGGHLISGLPTHRIANRGVGYVPEERRIFADLTVLENLEVGRRPPRADAPTWTMERILGLFPALAAMRQRPGGRMSGGEQQMLAIARTLVGNPSLLLLDEPSEGLAPLVVSQLASALTAVRDAGLTVLVAEQGWRFASAIADRALVLERGRIVHASTMEGLATDDDARRRLLGV